MTIIPILRSCNGCGRELRRATRAEIEAAIEGSGLPDVREECGCEGHRRVELYAAYDRWLRRTSL